MDKIKSVFLPFDQSTNNPYQKQLAQHLADFGVEVEAGKSSEFFLKKALMQWKPQILHLHWLHSFCTKSTFLKSLISSVIFISQLIILRLLGIKIIWTVHNLKNHNNKYLRLDRICTKIVAKLSHGIIAHCEKAKEEIISTFNLSNSDKVFAVPHGNYIGCYENNISRTEARRTLGIPESKTVLLFFGLIRPYKGVMELIDTFNQSSTDETELIIAGKVWNDSLEQADLLKQKTSENNCIKFIPGFVPDEKIQLYMNASDVVVFPYRDILTSGAVLLAMSFGKACIAPCIGCIGEVLNDSGAFLYNPDDSVGLLSAINKAIEKQDMLTNMGEHNYQLAKQLNWEIIAEKTFYIYQKCLKESIINSESKLNSIIG